MKTLKLSFAALALMAGASLQAQIPGTNNPPRTDDHFQRQLVVSRVDLTEKVNAPLVDAVDPALYGSNKYGENHGLVAALLNGLKSGKYLAYDADSLSKTMTYEEVAALSQSINGETEPEWEEEPIEEEEYYGEEEEESEDVFFENNSNSGTPDGEIQVAPFEASIEFIENRIFDKNRSDMVYDIQYIRLVWVDPAETLPDQNFVCFKYTDILETLEDTRWANRFNDAEDRNLREIFEERIFNSFVINVSGRGARTLQESAHRSNQMLEFEHNLWSY